LERSPGQHELSIKAVAYRMKDLQARLPAGPSLNGNDLTNVEAAAMAYHLRWSEAHDVAVRGGSFDPKASGGQCGASYHKNFAAAHGHFCTMGRFTCVYK
jgi:hypothetical protein